MLWKALLVNPPDGDPALFLELQNRSECYLLDCGDLRRLRVRDLRRIRRVFVTHSHIDHFIGFDHLLRMQLFCPHVLEVYGPVGMMRCVQGKLSGYVWNLTADSPFAIRAHELHEECVKSIDLPCRERFQPGPERCEPHEGRLVLDAGIELRFAPVHHNVECLAYRLTGPAHYRVSPERLHQAGVAPGPWLSRLKERMAAGDLQSRLAFEGNEGTAAELAERFLTVEPGPSLAYVSDTVYNRDSVRSLMPLIGAVDELWCESAYRHGQLDKARENLHLTARQAARLAVQAGVRKLHLFHFSRRYSDEIEPHLEEARQVFPQVEPAPLYRTQGDEAPLGSEEKRTPLLPDERS